MRILQWTSSTISLYWLCPVQSSPVRPCTVVASNYGHFVFILVYNSSPRATLLPVWVCLVALHLAVHLSVVCWPTEPTPPDIVNGLGSFFLSLLHWTLSKLVQLEIGNSPLLLLFRYWVLTDSLTGRSLWSVLELVCVASVECQPLLMLPGHN